MYSVRDAITCKRVCVCVSLPVYMYVKGIWPTL